MKTHLLRTIKKLGAKWFLVLATGFISFTSGAQTWGIQSSTITDNVNGIYFLHESDIGFSVADGGRILKTTDGGLTWSLKNSGTVKNLNAVYFGSMSNGFAVGDSGLVLMTTDGGDSWSTVASGTGEILNNIAMVSTTGFIVGDNGTILLMNTNGISSLTSNTTDNLYGVYMIDGSTAMVAGGGLISATLLATYNGGSVWVPLSTGAITQLNDVFFVNDSTGYVSGNGGTVLKTTTSGSSWSTQSVPAVNDLTSIYFVSADSGYAASSTGSIYRTINGGTSWTALTTGNTNSLNDISFSSQYRGYAAGDAGTVLKTCPVVYFEPMPNDSICIHETVEFSNQSHNSSTYVWMMNGDTVATSTSHSHTFDSTGIYSVKLIADNGTCTSSFTRSIFVDGLPVVDLGPDTTLCSSCTITLNAGNAGSTYVWFKDGIATGNISRTNTVGITGMYSVEVTNANGCMESDSIMVTISTGVASVMNHTDVATLYPNPNNKYFTLSFNIIQRQTTNITITNYAGIEVYHHSIEDFSGLYSENISLQNCSSGIYLVSIQSGGKTQLIKMIAY